jgi:hypothetical protein
MAHERTRTAMVNLGNPGKFRSLAQVPGNTRPWQRKSKTAPSADITADELAALFLDDCSGGTAAVVVSVVFPSSRRATNVENVTRSDGNTESHVPDAVTPTYNEEVVQQSEERVESATETAASLLHASFMSGVGASSHLYFKSAASASGIGTAAALRLSYLYSSEYLYLEYINKEIDSGASNSSSSLIGYCSDDEEEEQQEVEVEPFDVPAFFANVQSEHQSSISRCSAAPAVLSYYSACQGGQMPLYSNKEPAVEDVCPPPDWDELQARVSASACTTTVVDDEAEPCCEAAPMEERIMATSMAALLPVLPPGASRYLDLLHRPAAVCAEPMSSLGSSASSQASTEEDVLPEKMEKSAGGGHKVQKKIPVLLRLFCALGNAFMQCLGMHG